MRGMHPSARFGSGRGVAPVAPLPPPRRTPIRNEPTPETPPSRKHRICPPLEPHQCAKVRVSQLRKSSAGIPAFGVIRTLEWQTPFARISRNLGSSRAQSQRRRHADAERAARIAPKPPGGATRGKARERRPLVGTARRRRAAGQDPQLQGRWFRRRAADPQLRIPAFGVIRTLEWQTPFARISQPRKRSPSRRRRHANAELAHRAHATKRSDAQARERRPPVGTAPRSGASGAMLTERTRGRARERHLLGWGQRRDRNHPGAWRYATPPASGGLCRPPPGELARGRRSLAAGAICANGGVFALRRHAGEQRCAARWPAASRADRRSAFPGGRCHLHEWRCLCLAEPCGGAAMRRPLACGQLCRPEAGVP